ncbi:MAG: hypothetical protein M1812_001526 [Candelaria pacifica]|nr:MAG: hypothetical protein M1812_001526 [Candelaria pacifica]
MSTKLSDGKELVAILLATIDPARPLNYQDMSAFSVGDYTPSAVEHIFRPIKKRAEHLKGQLALGALQPKATPKRKAVDAEVTGDTSVAKKARSTKPAVGTKGKQSNTKQPKHANVEGADEDGNAVKGEEGGNVVKGEEDGEELA